MKIFIKLDPIKKPNNQGHEDTLAELKKKRYQKRKRNNSDFWLRNSQRSAMRQEKKSEPKAALRLG